MKLVRYYKNLEIRITNYPIFHLICKGNIPWLGM